MKSHHLALELPALALACLFSVSLVSAAPLPNAWQVTDSSSSGASGAGYSTNLPTALRNSALAAGWRLSVNCRLVDDFNDTGTMVFLYGVGTNRFSVYLDLDANEDLRATPYNQSAVVLTTNGTGRALYHTHEIAYNPTNKQAAYLFDGVQKATWAGDGGGVTAANGLISWGSGSTAGRGQMNFHAVTFRIGTNVVAAYDAGTENNPTNAPDPRSQSWAVSPTTGADTNAISPDRALLPVATTLAPDQYMPDGARLNGQVNPSGSPTAAWFEWGTTTNYGSATAMQNVGEGLSLSNISSVLNGLTVGPDYHYHLVASNMFGVVTGTNQLFNLSFLLTPIPGLPGVAAGSATWGDYDNDGRLDFLLTGSSSTGHVSQLWRNAGAGFTNVPIPGLPGVSEGSVAWGDYDNDGRLDFLLTGTTNGSSGGVTSQLWRNTGSGFSNVTASVAPSLTRVVNSSGTWGDYDNDGRLDFLITGFQSGGAVFSQLWRNTGSGFTNVPVPGLPGVYHGSVAWGDYDNDGWLDLLLTGSRNPGNVAQLWRNTGSGFSNVTASVASGLPQISNSSVAWGDYDNDGKLDFIFTGQQLNGSAISQLWRNTGSGFINVPIPGLPGASSSSVAWGDYDNDGRLDFLLVGLDGTERRSQLWRNTGNGFTNVPIPGLPGVAAGSATWGDSDNDGRLDFLQTGSLPIGVTSQVWRNNMPSVNASPGPPTNPMATVSGVRATLSWNAPADDHTPPLGLSYNVRIGTTPGGSNILSPHALADGTRLVPQMGNAGGNLTTVYQLPAGQTYYWSVQAVDTSFAGSPFAAEQQFTVGYVAVSTDPTATGLEPHQASLSGLVNPSGLPTSYWFEWGTTTSYGNSSPPQALGSGDIALNVAQTITGLTKGTPYHFRCAASNALGVAYGLDASFSTPPVFTVNALADSGTGSLRQSISRALPGDTITFSTNGDIVLIGGRLLITNDLTLVGVGPTNLAVSGNNSNRVFEIARNVTVRMSGISIKNGRSPNGVTGTSGSSTGTKGESGGGVYNSGTLILSNCVITGNTAGTGGNGYSPSNSGDGTGGAGGVGGDGGGIYNAGTLTLLACTVSFNSSGRGGNGGSGGDGAGGPATPYNGTAGGAGGMGGAGGGIFSSGVINLSACTIYSNLAGIGGGGGSGGDGYGPGDGAIGGAGGTGGTAGGLFNQGNFSLLALTNCTLSGNSAGSGGAGGIGGSAEFDAGSGGNGGRGGRGGDCGGIYNENSLQLTACTVSSNRSGAGGSGGNGGADVGNPLDRDGGDGGIGGSGGNGGGIIASPNASLTSLRNTLIAQNTAGTLGLGGSGRDNGINGSSGTNGIRQDLLGTFTSAGHNFVGINDGGFSIANPMPTDLIPQPGFQINPLLGPLADNGGPTLTLALQRFGMLDSPAIDAGDDSLINTLATDQRGLPRRSGAHVDIGAFELQETVLASPPLLSQPEWLGSGGFKFSFSNVSDASFSVLSSTNIALPRSNWTLLGPATQNSPGHYLFTDPVATNFPQRYYQVVSP